MPIFSRQSFRGYHRTLFPQLAQLLDRTTPSHPDGFWANAEAFNDFFKSDFVTRFFEVELQKIAEQFDYSTEVLESGITLLQTADYSLAIGKLNHESMIFDRPAGMAAFENNVMYCNLGPGSLSVAIYEVPNDQMNHVFDRTLRPQLSRTFVQEKGEVISLRAGRDVLQLTGGTGKSYQIFFISKAVDSLIWFYDETSLLPTYCTASSNRASRIQSALHTLVRLGSKKAIPQIQATFQSADHFVRWSAVRAALALDEVAGRELLGLALCDPHPHVRTAAERTVTSLESLPSHNTSTATSEKQIPIGG